MSDLETLRKEAKEALLKRIAEEASKGSAHRALMAAEAYAWVVSPTESHGGASSPTTT